MTKYACGRRFEYKVRDRLVELGFFVVRAAGSKGPVDLIAFKKYVPPLLIQCKKAGILTKNEKMELISLARQISAAVILAKDKNGVVFDVLWNPSSVDLSKSLNTRKNI